MMVKDFNLLSSHPNIHSNRLYQWSPRAEIMETTTMSGGFGGIPIGQEIPGTAPMGVLYFITTAIPSTTSGGLSNVMNILASASLAPNRYYNVMTILTMMVGVPPA